MAMRGYRDWVKEQPLWFRRGLGVGRRKFSRDPVWDDPEFRQHYAWLQETETWPRERLEQLQARRLRQLIAHAYENVPYYRNLFHLNGIKPEDIRQRNDLQKIPFTTRKEVQQNLEDCVAKNFDQVQLTAVSTGGTTGIPLTIYHDHSTYAHESAFRLRQWSWAGYRRGDRLLILRDDFAGRRDRSGRILSWDYHTTENALVLSAFHLNEANMPEYLTLIRKFRPQFISTFPSAIGMLAMHMRRHSVDDIRVKAIFCESETIYPWQRELIETQFGCKIYSGYGNSERAIDAVEAECHQGYHVCMEYGILEIVDDEGNPIEEAGRRGIVVGTGLDTFCMPMIRYKTEDVASFSHQKCTCGRDWPLIAEIEGRLHEVVVTQSNELIPVGILQIRSPAYQNVAQFQFVQRQIGELIIKIVPTEKYSSKDSDLISDELQDQFGGAMQLQVVKVQTIPRTSRGKFRFLEQNLPIEFAGFRWSEP
jgi:phenylacetate-CoA ligase